MRSLPAFLVLFLVCFSSGLQAQHWEPTPDKSHHESIVKITDQEEGWSGSGAVISRIKDSEKEGYYIGLILTASHVIPNSNSLFRIDFDNGCITKGAKVIRKGSYNSDPFNDIAVIQGLVPDSVKPLEMCYELPRCGEKLECAGYGRGSLKHWSAEFACKVFNQNGLVLFGFAVQGDSGGPVLYDHDDNPDTAPQVIGVICFGSAQGYFEDTSRLIVCPINCSNVNRIKGFLLNYITEHTS
jgi:hypothetical protein